MSGSRPQVPELPPPRAMERLPNRGVLGAEARRRVTSTFGAPGRQQTNIMPPALSAMRGATAARGSSAPVASAYSPILGG